MRAGLQMRLLGPFEVRLDGGQLVALGGLRQRALLAILTLHANEVVSTERLVDELWGERPPATAVHTVQVFVSRLRNALGPAGERLATRPPGYALEVGLDAIDADRCERLYSSARAALAAGNALEAEAQLREAMDLWRGAPLAEFTYEPFAQAAIARFEELRMSCREELIEAQLALGRHAEAVAELEALVREQPFRERSWGQLMLALYRCGRQADALDAFQHARRALMDELGVEPSAALRDLEQGMLQQDESLGAPSAPAAAPSLPSGGIAGEADRGREPVSATEPPIAEGPAQTEVLRKTATVLAARLQPAEHADPERARTLVRSARGHAETVISRHGGTFVAGLGSELVAVFGLPVTREDDALRAVRAADELRLQVSALSGGDSGALITRIGVDTGEVVAEAAGDLFGDPLVNGISLARGAQNGEVILSDATRALGSEAIEVERVADGTGWRLLSVAEPSARRVRRSGPMVGREAELLAARAAFEHSQGAGEATLLTVIGEAGIGKSRLSEALVDELVGRATVLRGRCLSYGDGVALWPMREALTALAGGESRRAIRGLLGDEQDAELIADIAAAALGLGPGEGIGEQVNWAFRRILETVATPRPAVLLIDDAHWGGPPLLDLIDYLIDWLTAPVLVVCLGRPELLELRPEWGGGHARVSSVVLGPLDEQDALHLLVDRLGDRRLSDAETVQILETAEGNPLFVEQLLAMSAEDPWWGQQREVPATLQALLAARLDRLGPGERAVVQRAAVIGRGFWLAAVREMLPVEARPSADQHLRTLVHRGLIHPERASRPGQEELRFHHILIRDVAYRGVPKALRAELHEQFADWLAPRYEGSEEFVGYHLERAVADRTEVRPVDSKAVALAARGGGCLAVAGRRALARGDANAAAKLLHRSATLFETTGDLRPDILLDTGIALGESGEFGQMERALQTALAQAADTHQDALAARASIELSFQRALVDPGFRVSEMLEVAERAIAVFSRAGDEAGLARAWEHVGEVHWIRGRCAEMEPVLERALEHADRAVEPLQRSRILTMLAAAAVFGPRFVDDAVRRCNMILDRAHDDLRVTAITETMLAVLEAMKGEFDRARDRFSRTKVRLDDVGLGITAAAFEMYRALIELMAGSPEKAEPDVAAAYRVLEQTGERYRLATTAALLARLLYAQGRIAEAERYGAISEETASEDDLASQVLWRGTRAKVLAHAGEARAAEELARGAVALAEASDLLVFRADALADYSEVMSLLDRPQEAMGYLEQAIALYEAKGARVLADAARRTYGPLAALVDAPNPAQPA